MAQEPLDLAIKFFDHWSANQIDDAIGMLSTDVLYDNVPFPDIVGRENVRKFHSDFGLGSSFKVDWQIKAIAAAGNLILNERLDIFIHESGGRITLPVMGTLTIENGMITVWRDYFDPGDFDKQLSAIAR